MRAAYKCPNCDVIKEVLFPIIAGPPKEVFCDNCGQIMQRNWKASIHIPEDFSDDLTTTIGSKMAHAARPTGKSKVNY